MQQRSARLAMLVAFVTSFAFHPISTATTETQPAGPEGNLVSPEALLNPDGTLRLDGGLSGSVDLEGWSVQIDDIRGPVFTPEGPSDAGMLQTASPGEWAALSYGGPDVRGYVNAMAMLGSDLIVAGSFTDVANIAEADYIAAWDGSSWSALGSSGYGGGVLNNTAQALLVVGTDLYVGGYFQNITFKSTYMPTVDYVAKWDGSDWLALGDNGSGNGSLNGGVLALALLGGDVYAGGLFTNVNNGGSAIPEADFVARWDGSDWFALGSNGASNGSLGANVQALEAVGGNLFVGGAFTDVNNGGSSLGAADYVAMWDGTDWSALGDDGSGGGGNGSLNQTVYALRAFGTDILVGGGFTNVNNGGTTLNAADYVARWDGSNWSALGSGGGGTGSITSYVYDLWVDGTDVYAGGTFWGAYNGVTFVAEAANVAVFDTVGGLWSGLGDNGSGGSSISGGVYTVLTNGSSVYAGGYFQGVNNSGTLLLQAYGIAMWDGSDWSPVGGYQGTFREDIYAMAVSGSDLYVGGYFMNLVDDGVPNYAADMIARWDGSSWHSLGDSGFGEGVLTSSVNAILVDGSNVYVGGCFSDIASGGGSILEADFLARFDGTDWHAVGDDGGGGGSLNGCVRALAKSGSNLYVGGDFTNVNNGGSLLDEADHVARWDGTDWHAMGNNGSGNGALDDSDFIYAMAAIGSDVYIGGYFFDVMNGATPLDAADYIARWNGSNWSSLGDNGSGGPALNDTVNALAVIGSDLYVGGSFYDVSNSGTPVYNADYVARWNGSSWSGVGAGTSGSGSIVGIVYALATRGSQLYAAGAFEDVNNGGTPETAADFVARWDGSTWHSLGDDGAGDGSIDQPAGPYLNEIAVSATDAYVSGYFWNVNNGGTALEYADYLAAYGLAPLAAPSDFDGDLISDPAKFVPGTGYAWWHATSSNSWAGMHMGADVAAYVPRSDFDGDGMTDPAKYVAAGQGLWYFRSSDSTWQGVYMGSGSYYILPGSDFDGDGTSDPAKYLSTGSIWRLPSTGGGWVGTYVGTDAAPALPGSDYDGDGQDDLAKYVSAAGAVWYYGSSDNTWHGVYIGSDGTPVPASDFDGDGTTDMAKYLTGSNSLWYRRSSDLVWVGVYLGPGSFTYVPANDFDGDGKTDPTKFDTVGKGLWWLKSTTGTWGSQYMGGETYSIVN